MILLPEGNVYYIAHLEPAMVKKFISSCLLRTYCKKDRSTVLLVRIYREGNISAMLPIILHRWQAILLVCRRRGD